MILDIFEFDQRVIPTLFERGSDQAMARVDFFVTALSQLGFVLSSVQTHLPLCIDLFVPMRNNLTCLDGQLNLLAAEHFQYRSSMARSNGGHCTVRHDFVDKPSRFRQLH